jgi:hypothetical protein
MKIMIIGHSSEISSKLMDINLFEYSFVTLTNCSGLPWRFGEECNLKDFLDVERIIFLAWDKSNLNSSYLSLKYIMNTINSFPTPINLLFISSYAIFNGTRYGNSKLFGEEIVNSHGQKFIRVPLIYDNVGTFELTKLIKLVKIFKILPSSEKWGGEFEVVKYQDLSSEIIEWINFPTGFQSPGFTNVDFKKFSIRNLLSIYGITELKNNFFVDLFAKILLYIIFIYGSKSRIFDSILSFYPQNQKSVKQKFLDSYE